MFTLKISTANAAFDDPRPEIARILREVAGTIEDSTVRETGYCRDINGNTVGSWKMPSAAAVRRWAFPREASR